MRLQDLGTRKDLYMIAPEIIHEEEGWNVRAEGEDLEQHIQTLAASIREIGVQEPLTVYLRDEEVVLTNGHCRLAAVKRLLAEGVEIKAVPVRVEAKTANDADRVLSMITRNSGRPLSPMELAAVCKRLVAFNWTPATIAAKTGYSAGYINQLLGLSAAPAEVQSMVAAGRVSASLAAKVVRQHGKNAPETLKNALAKANKRGKAKATAQDLPKAELAGDTPFEQWFERYCEVNGIASDGQFAEELHDPMRDAFLAGVESTACVAA